MSATLTRPTPVELVVGTERHGAGADAAIARRAFRQVRTGAIACGLAFGATVAVTASSYVSSFPSAASRHELAVSTGRDSGLAVLLGPVTSLETVGGYTVYKLFVFLTTIAALWSLLAATRLLRGEEDAGRWQIVLAGNTRATRATAATLIGLGAAIGVVAAAVSIFTWLAGRDGHLGFGAGDSVVYAASIAVPAAVFAAVGAVTAQIGKTRRVAVGIGVVVIAASFVLRMIADSGSGTRWLAWVTPFGWSENVHPFTRNNLVPFLPATLTVVALGLLAIVLAARRDAGDGIVSGREDAAPREFGLRSPSGLARRLELPTLVAWCSGVFAAGVAFGIVAKAATSASSSLRNALDKFDVAGSFATKYAGVAFLLVATVIALLPASQLSAASDEESSGRLVHILAAPERRAAWLAGRLLLCAVAVVAAALLAGSGFWIGAATQGVNLGLLDMLGAGANAIPTALLSLGLGAVVFVLAPRHAAASVYANVGFSIVVQLLGTSISSLRVLERLSLFDYMPLVPAQDPDPVALVATVAGAVVLGVAATLLFEHRDVGTE